MRFFPRSTPPLVFLVLLALCMVARAQTPAAPGPISFEVASPLALTQKPLALQVRKGRWFPIAVTLANTGEAVQGVLTLRLSRTMTQNRSATRYFTEVDLPTNARKRVWLYGRVESDDVSKWEIIFQGSGFKPMATDGVVQVADPQTRLVLTISDSDEKLSYLAGLQGVGLALPDDAPVTSNVGQAMSGVPIPNLNANTVAVRPLGAPHDLIPSRWVGLDAVDLVVLQDFSHNALTPNQIAALRGYAASGGALLALGGADWQRLANSPLADLWPVVPQSSGVASAATVSTLVNRFARFPVMTGADRLGGAPVIATRGVLKSGSRLLLGDKNAPILAANDFGAGQVLFLSVDPTQPPFLGWRGHARMWADVFRPTSRPAQIASVGETAFEQDQNRYNYTMANVGPANATAGLLESLKTSKQLKTPPVSAIAWFLALYVFFLVPVNYVVLRYFDRRELAWVTIPVIVLAFSAMSYAAALRIKGTAILTRQVNIVQTSDGSNMARADAMLWLFSPKKTTYDISSREPQMVVGDYLSDNNVAVEIREPEENRAFALDAAPINMWDWRSFVGHSTTDMKGGVRAVVQNGKVGIANNSPYDLKGATLVSDGRVIGFRTVRAGSTSFDGRGDNIQLSNAQLVGRIRFASRLEQELPQNQVGGYENIPDRLLATALKNDWSTPSTFIVAWSDKPFAGLTIGREDDRAQHLTLLVVRVEDDTAIHAALETDRSASTSMPARVRRLSVEAQAAQRNRTAESLYIYEAQFENPTVNQVVFSVNLALENRDGYPMSVGSQFKSAKLEVFDFQTGVWRDIAFRDLEAEKLRAEAKVRPTPTPRTYRQRREDPFKPTKWHLRATLSGNLARSAILQPDGRIQFRVRTYHDDVRVKEVRVRSEK